MPVSGRQEARNDLHGGGFARAVRPQKTEYLAAVRLKTHLVYGVLLAVNFCQLLYGYRHETEL